MVDIAFALGALAAPFLAAAIGGAGGRSRSRRDFTARVASAVVATGFGAVAAAVIVGALTAPGRIEAGPIILSIDVLAVLMLLLILGLSAVIQSFAVRYLRGDSRQRWFVVTANLVTGFSAVTVCAGSVALFAAAWVAVGGSLLLLLATYPGLAQAREGVRRAALRFSIGDLALVAAVILILLRAGGDVPFDRLGSVTDGVPGWLVLLLAALVLLPGLARSTQVPFHGWLPSTLAAPTPVSALLHAGVVNAGAILVIRFAPLVGEVAFAMTVLFLAGAATVLYASLLRLVKADVKGRLVFSTMAQMGFMMMACGLGAFAAAVFHLIAHGLFKSALFLGAGSAVRRHAQQREWPVRQPARGPKLVAVVACAVVLPAASIVLARALLAPQISVVSAAFLVFVAVTGAVSVAAMLLVRFSVGTLVIAAVGTVALAFGYTAFLAVFDSLIPGSGALLSPASPWLLLIPAVALVAIEVMVRRNGSSGAIRRGLYAGALAAATTPLREQLVPSAKGAHR
ncbi:MAG: proton-conducting transporter membrane subunit [Actinomycetota bacterium]